MNNDALERAVLGYAAKFSARYGVRVYALAIEGNHIQGTAHFPNANRSSYMRDFNSCVARAVPRYTPEFPGGRLWGRRFSAEFLPDNDDIEDRFFYTVLQPVQDGLVEKISDYPGYNCFHDAINGIERKFKVVRWGEYNAARRWNVEVSVKAFTDTVKLSYARLPGYEHLSQREYAKLMREKLENRRKQIVDKRAAKGLGFVGRERLLKLPRGRRAKNTKRSARHDFRPRILAVCAKRRAKWVAWYFDVFFAFKDASKRYRSGEVDVAFPEGTYKPYCSALSPPT